MGEVERVASQTGIWENFLSSRSNECINMLLSVRQKMRQAATEAAEIRFILWGLKQDQEEAGVEQVAGDIYFQEYISDDGAFKDKFPV